MIEPVLALIVFLDVIFALICVQDSLPLPLRNLLGKALSVNYFGLLREVVMSVDWQNSPTVVVMEPQQFGRQMRLHRIGSLKRNLRATSVVYMEYNGVTGKRQSTIHKKRLRTTSVVNTTGKVTSMSKRRINSKIYYKA